MPGQRRDFTEHHRAACVRARIERGLTHAAIAELAWSEGLYGVEFPSKPAVSTVEAWCREEVTAEDLDKWLLRYTKARLTLEMPDLPLPKALSLINQARVIVEKGPKQNRASQQPKPKQTVADESAGPEAPTLERMREQVEREGQAIADAAEFELASRALSA